MTRMCTMLKFPKVTAVMFAGSARGERTSWGGRGEGKLEGCQEMGRR